MEDSDYQDLIRKIWVMESALDKIWQAVRSYATDPKLAVKILKILEEIE